METQVIVVKRGIAYSGVLDDTEFIPDGDAWKSDDPALEGILKGYIPLHDFLLLTNPKQKKKESEDARKEIGYSQVFVYVEDNDDYWAYFNHKCNTCKRKCKQSHKVEVVACPQYEAV